MEKVKVAVIGCGNISHAYFGHMKNFPILDVVACADLNADAAKEKAKEHEIPQTMSVDDVFNDSEIEIVVNLTIPQAHYEIAKRTLESGKHAHSEKPFTVSREEGRELLKLAEEKNLLVGSAPDTFLGGAHQTARKLIDDGWIGKPIGCNAFMLTPGHERWHANPEFYYKKGGGPMFDMGPYYLTDLVQLLGPVRRVVGSTSITHAQRTITSEPLNGQIIDVEVPTHVVGIMEFANGATGQITTSFDIWGHNMPCIEIYGSKGSLFVPDPNGFGGEVKLALPGQDVQVIPHSHIYGDSGRGLGVADLAHAIREGRKQRCSGDLAYHVLDLMHAFHDASDQSKYVDLESTCERPAPMEMGLLAGNI